MLRRQLIVCLLLIAFPAVVRAAPPEPNRILEMIDVVINWGRYAELFGYSPDDERLYLDQPSQAAAVEQN